MNGRLGLSCFIVPSLPPLPLLNCHAICSCSYSYYLLLNSNVLSREWAERFPFQCQSLLYLIVESMLLKKSEDTGRGIMYLGLSVWIHRSYIIGRFYLPPSLSSSLLLSPSLSLCLSLSVSLSLPLYLSVCLNLYLY